MNRKNSMLMILLSLLSIMLILSACGIPSTTDSKDSIIKKEDKYEKLVKEKNKELELEPLELSSYSEEIGATFKQPKYKKFAVNGEVVVEGKIEKYSQLKTDYVWIIVRSNEEGPAGDEFEYRTPIKNGKFKQAIHFFNGEGEYSVDIKLPSTDSEDYFYDTAAFDVINVNPAVRRDVAYTQYGREAELAINMKSGYVKEKDGIFSLEGKAGNLSGDDTIMITLDKDSETWQHILPIENGKFEFDIPLYYGEGVHELTVLVPDEDREDYYQTATTILIDNESSKEMDPINYTNAYIERGVTLEYPKFGGDEAEGTYKVKGFIDPKAEFARETTHIYIKTKKGEDEALDVIPVENYKFNGSFYLRFGPGTYEVTVSVPEIQEKNSDHFSYYGFAQFEVNSNAPDQRDLLPSRGVQSDAPQIKKLASEITSGKSTDLEKSKAIYDYVAKNIAYDVDKLENSTFAWDDSALKTLELKSGVCQDYAYLAIALLRASDIEARFIEGKTGGGFFGEAHGWAEVNVDGRWLTMDPTWGAGYIQDGKFVAQYDETYFDPNMSEFNQTHTRTGVVY